MCLPSAEVQQPALLPNQEGKSSRGGRAPDKQGLALRGTGAGRGTCLLLPSASFHVRGGRHGDSPGQLWGCRAHGRGSPAPGPCTPTALRLPEPSSDGGTWPLRALSGCQRPGPALGRCVIPTGGLFWVTHPPGTGGTAEVPSEGSRLFLLKFRRAQLLCPVILPLDRGRSCFWGRPEQPKLSGSHTCWLLELLFAG